MTSRTELSIEADLGRLAEVRRFVREATAPLGADVETVSDLVQAVDEWVTNVIVHGYRSAGGPIEVSASRDGDAIAIVVRDRAPAFDPRSASAFDPDTPLEGRRFGGMGIHLIRELSDRFEHHEIPGGGNEVTIAKTPGRRGGVR